MLPVHHTTFINFRETESRTKIKISEIKKDNTEEKISEIKNNTEETNLTVNRFNRNLIVK